MPACLRCARMLGSPLNLDREFGFISGLHASASGLFFDDRVYTRLACDRVSGHVRYLRIFAKWRSDPRRGVGRNDFRLRDTLGGRHFRMGGS